VPAPLSLRDARDELRSGATGSSLVSRARFSAWNYFSSMGLTGLALKFGFVATPVILHWLGQERLGASRVATDWIGYLGLLELRLSGALLPVLTRSIGRCDAQNMRFAIGRPYAAAVWWIAHNTRLWDWLGLAVEIAAAAGAFLVLAWFVLFDRNDRQLWSARLRAALLGQGRAAGATSA
jgi:hypothetical protein